MKPEPDVTTSFAAAPSELTLAEELFSRLPRARVIVELAADGTYVLEIYKNNSLTRKNIGTDYRLISETLGELAASIQVKAERKLRRLEAEAAARSQRAYFPAVADHGKRFTDKPISRPASLRKSPQAKAVASDLSAVLDLF